jgi:hypothetical protein
VFFSLSLDLEIILPTLKSCWVEGIMCPEKEKPNIKKNNKMNLRGCTVYYV